MKRDRFIDVETVVEKPVYVERFIEENAELVLNTKNEQM